jgi:hypothetical protein
MRYTYIATCRRQDGSIGPCVFNCTATVIAPYTVLTAAHCTSDRNDLGRIRWDDAGREMAVTDAYNNPYLESPFRPAWWTALDDAQRAAGGRINDWPAQHDLRVLFVRDLTPELLRDERLEPIAIDPRATASTFTAVGVGSTGGATRDFIRQRYVQTTPGSITVSPRDGYLNTDHLALDFGNTNGGDSGGPAIGASVWSWLDGSRYRSGRYIVGTFQNGPKDNGVAAGDAQDLAPLAYDPGIEMSANQRLTVRLNSLWVQARADDPDDDGFATSCDANPTASGPTTDNLCPASVGGLRGVARRQAPMGQLACRPGYVAVGLQGGAGYAIDRLAVQCRALSCFGHGAPACEGVPAYEYWTDHFGGNGGAAFTSTCPAGQVLVGVSARHNDVDGWIHGLAARCAPRSTVVSGGPLVTQLAWAGSPWWGADAVRDCGGTRTLVGFQARSADGITVTSLQPICSTDMARHQTYMGGHGGGDTTLRCPVGLHAIGTVQNTESGGINAFGLLCGPRNLRGDATPNDRIVVVRGGYMHYGTWRGVPPMVEPLASARLPASAVSVRCPTYMTGLEGRVGTWIERIDALRCATGVLSPSFTRVPVNVGTASASSYYQGQWCGAFKPVDGLYIRTGWLTDGFALRCGE